MSFSSFSHDKYSAELCDHFYNSRVVVGNFANVFIALVNCTDWAKRQRISSIDRILTALAVSRVALLSIMLTGWFFALFNPALNYKIITHLFWITTNDFSIWISTSLSIYYLLKITNFSNHIFLHLKKKVHSVVVLTLCSGLLLILSRLVIFSVYHSVKLEKYKGNVTWKIELENTFRSAFAIEYFIPIIISVICFLVLIYSLHKHLKHMHQYSNGSEDPSTKVHVKALKTMVSFLLLVAMYSLCEIISNWSFNVPQHESVHLLASTFTTLYPSVHSWVLIWGNRKLKQAFVLHLWPARC